MSWSFDNSAFRDFIRDGVHDSFGQPRKVTTVRVIIPGGGTYEIDLTEVELQKLLTQIDNTQRERRFEHQRKQQEQAQRDRERARREQQRAKEQARKMQQDWDFINEAFRKINQDWSQFTFPNMGGVAPLQRLAELAKVEWPTELSKEKLYRKAQRHCHPDTGGSHDLWLELDELRRTLQIN